MEAGSEGTADLTLRLQTKHAVIIEHDMDFVAKRAAMTTVLAEGQRRPGPVPNPP